MNARRLLCVAGLGVILLSGNSCMLDAQTRAEGTFDRMLVVNGPVDLDIRTGSGTIQIRTGASDSIHVIGHVRAGMSWFVEGSAEDRVKQIVAAPPIEQSGASVRIGRTTDEVLFRNISISYDVTVPVDTRLRSRSGSGAQTIGSLRGPVDAGAGSGSIRIGQVGGDVQASIGSGDIELERADGSFNASAGSGWVTAKAVGGAVKARAGSGHIDVTQTGQADVEVMTGSGSIAVTGARGGLDARAGSGDIAIDGQPAQNWNLKAGSGDITMRLTENAAFDLDARTGSGVVETSHPLTATGVVSRSRLQGTVRGGGPKLNVATASGSIRIR